MTSSLNGVIFDQVYGDNSGASEFDSDGDGTTTQEDEFVSFTNTSGGAIDISGWQIWSDSTGTNAEDDPVDGLYHTFAPGTILAPGETIYIINEISGDPRYNAQEASEGGVESGAGGTSTNLLTEGGTESESIALVDPNTGDFLVFNMDDQPSAFSEFDGGGTSSNSSLAGFPGTNSVGEVDGHAVASDAPDGTSYQYNYSTNSYETGPVFIACFGPDTRIETPRGKRPISELRAGDLVTTLDHGAQPVLASLHYHVSFDHHATQHLQPIAFNAGSIASGQPDAALTMSPQHRIMHRTACGREVLAPAKGFVDRRGVRPKRGQRQIHYYHLLLERHEIIFANNLPVESLFLGDYTLRRMHPNLRREIDQLRQKPLCHAPIRPLIGCQAMRRHAVGSPWPVA
ncbi:Hint domain-containing protein [Tateyamaria sp. SN6-1]|uniref:Hint domain-containing protein n=1 Tax=Tateyamaria sp. SN6-1 TaxID=3092148 RepID=UPI0039F5C48C